MIGVGLSISLVAHIQHIMFGLGIKEILIIAVVLIVLFGSRKIPELAQSLVDAVRTMRKVFDSADEPSAVAKK